MIQLLVLGMLLRWRLATISTAIGRPAGVTRWWGAAAPSANNTSQTLQGLGSTRAAALMTFESMLVHLLMLLHLLLMSCCFAAAACQHIESPLSTSMLPNKTNTTPILQIMLYTASSGGGISIFILLICCFLSPITSAPPYRSIIWNDITRYKTAKCLLISMEYSALVRCSQSAFASS